MTATANKLGFTREGYKIVVQGCAEDNSGVVFEHNGKFVMRMTYPIDMKEDGTEIFMAEFNDEREAVRVFKSSLGNFGYGD